MKILYFNDFRLGVLNGDQVVDVTDLVQEIPHTGPHNLISGLIERFPRCVHRLLPELSRGLLLQIPRQDAYLPRVSRRLDDLDGGRDALGRADLAQSIE